MIRRNNLKRIISCVMMIAMMMMMMLVPVSSAAADGSVTSPANIGFSARIADNTSAVDAIDVAAWYDVEKGDAGNNNYMQFATAWDDTNYYVSVKVGDTSVLTGDAVEIYIDATNIVGGAKKIQLSYNVSGTKNVNVDGKDVSGSSKVSVGFAKSNIGYEMMVTIPFAELGMPENHPHDGDVLGFEVVNLDVDAVGSTAAALKWNNSSKTDSTTWGYICLYYKVKPIISKPTSSAPTIDGSISSSEAWEFYNYPLWIGDFELASLYDDDNVYIALRIDNAEKNPVTGYEFMLDNNADRFDKRSLIHVANQSPISAKNSKAHAFTATSITDALDADGKPKVDSSGNPTKQAQDPVVELVIERSKFTHITKGLEHGKSIGLDVYLNGSTIQWSFIYGWSSPGGWGATPSYGTIFLSEIDEADHAHTYQLIASGNGQHMWACSDSACGYKANPEKCFGGTSSCIERAACTACSQLYGSNLGHTPSQSNPELCELCGRTICTGKTAVEWSTDAQSHWLTCTCDEKEHDRAEHIPAGRWTKDDKGNPALKCDVCGYILESMGASAPAKAVTNLTSAGKLATLLKIDGALKEGVWKNAVWNEIANRQIATQLNNQGEFATAWNANNFYIAVKVTDDTVAMQNLNADMSCNDGIEIFIDPNNVKEENKYDEKTIRLIYQVADGKWKILGGTSMKEDVTAKYPNVKALHSIVDGGYIVEVSFPFAELGVEKPNDGRIMGIEVINNDDDNITSNAASDRYVLYWNKETKAESPDTWGNVCLYNAAKPIASYHGTAKIDGVIFADEGWTFTSEAKRGNAKLNYRLASMCDNENLYLAIDLKGTGLDNSGMQLLIDPDNSKGPASGRIMQFLHYSFKNNTRDSGNARIKTASAGGDSGYILEMCIPLDVFDYKPGYLDTIGLEIEMFTVHKSYDNAHPRVSWSNATTDSVFSNSSSFGTIVINSKNIAGGGNNAPTGNRISSYSIADGQKLSGTVTVTDPDGDLLMYQLDSYNAEDHAKNKGTFEIDELTGEWTYTPPFGVDMSNKIVNYYIEADDGKGASFHQRIEIRIEPKPTYNTYHLDGDVGDNKNDGLSHNTAFKTLQHAVDQLGPGDTLLVHESDIPYGYAQKYEIRVTKSGLPEAYITIKAADGEQPVINTNGYWNSLKISGSYVIVDGLTVTGIMDKLMPSMADNYSYYQQALTGGGLHSKVGQFNTNGISIAPGDGQSLGEKGVDDVKVTHHVVVKNCVMEYLGGGGIGTSTSDYITIENNTITNCCWGNMYANSGISVLGNVDIDNNYDAHKIVIRNNITAGNRHFVPWIHVKKFSDGNGIIIDSTDNVKTNTSLLNKGDKWGAQPYMSRFLVANNLSFFNGGSGIHAFDAANVDIINNTLYSNGSTPVLSREYSDLFSNASEDVRMYNNIVYTRTGGYENISSTSSSEVVYDCNLFYNSAVNNLGKNIDGKNGKAGTTAGENNLYNTDPLFKNVYAVNYDKGIAYPKDWTDYMIQYAKDGGYFIGADYNVNILGFDFSLKDDSPALGSGNKEWSELLGNTENRMGIFGTIGSKLRPVTVSK